MRKLILVAATFAFFSAAAVAQWQYEGGFPSDTSYTSSIHGLAVDAENKVWVQAWPNDVRVYNEDGTEVDFSPLDTLLALPDGGVDTLNVGNTRGLRADHEGNILLVRGDGSIYRLNHQTGEVMDKAVLPEGSAMSAPGVDDNGNIYTAYVVPGTGPIRVHNPDFSLLEVAVDTSRGFSRSFDVSGDGNAIYWAGYSNQAIWKYSRPDEFSPFDATPDTLFRGIGAEAIVRNWATGDVWVSNAPAAGQGYDSTLTGLAWYAIDTETDTFVDSLVTNENVAFADSGFFARAIAFSADGMTGYIGIWNQDGAAAPAATVQKFTMGADVAIERTGLDLPTDFTLDQNYPNPFNPATKIDFALTAAGPAKLTVYDALGRQVAVLLNESLQPGSYTATFDGATLPSGTYLYMLELNGQRLSKTMLLLK